MLGNYGVASQVKLSIRNRVFRRRYFAENDNEKWERYSRRVAFKQSGKTKHILRNVMSVIPAQIAESPREIFQNISIRKMFEINQVRAGKTVLLQSREE